MSEEEDQAGAQQPESTRRKRDSESRMVLRRIRLAKDLRSSLKVHEAEIAGRLEELLAPRLEDGERLEATTLLRAVNRMISDRLQRLEDSAEVRRQELDQDFTLRQRRRHWTGELRRALMELRRAARGLFGKAAAERFLGIGGRTARDLVGLQRQAQRVVDRIADPTRPKPEPRRRGIVVDWEQQRKQMERPLRELEGVDRDLVRDEGETDSSCERQRRELARFDRQVNAAARWLMATYELIGYLQARRHLLPETRSRRRNRRKAGVTETTEGAERSNRGEFPV